MESLWKETKKHELLPAKGDEPAFVVTLKHIGSKEDPFAWNRLQAKWTRIKEALRIKVRKDLIASYGSPEEATAQLLDGWKEPSFSLAVMHWLEQSDEYITALSERVQDLIVQGMVGGEETLDAVYEAGGTGLLRTAAAAVVSFHEVSPSQGEA